MKKILILTIIILVSNVVFCEIKIRTSTITISSVVTRTNMVADFEQSPYFSLWGGDIFSFRKSTDSTISFSTYTSHPRDGRCLKISYNNKNLNSYCGLSIGLAPSITYSDITEYRSLLFWIKSDEIGQRPRLEIKNKSTNIAYSRAIIALCDYLDLGTTTTWQLVKIPINAFVNLDSLENVTQLNFIFEYDYENQSGFPKSGTIFIDDIQFSTNSIGFLRIDHFADSWGQNALGGNCGDMWVGISASHNHIYDTNVYHEYPGSLKSNYNVINGWCGMFFIFGGGETGWENRPIDLSNYTKIVFWIKSKSSSETPSQIKLELVDNSGTKIRYITGVNTTWQKYTINLSDFIGLQKNCVKQFNFIYEDITVGTNKIGSVYYDEISFE